MCYQAKNNPIEVLRKSTSERPKSLFFILLTQLPYIRENLKTMNSPATLEMLLFRPDRLSGHLKR